MTDWAKLVTDSKQNSNWSGDKKTQTGIYNTPVGSLIHNAVDSANSFANMGKALGFEGAMAGATLMGNKQAANAQDPYLTSDETQKFSKMSTALPETVGRTANFFGNVDAAANLPNVVKTLPQIVSNAKLLTSKGAGQAINSAVEAAKGAKGNVSDLLTEMKQAVEDEFAPQGLETADPELQNAFGKMVKHVTGVDMEPSTLSKMDNLNTIKGDYTPEGLVSARRSIVKRYGYNPESGNIDQKVANVVRDVLTKRAKDITPGLTSADKAFVRSQQLKEMLPTIAKFIGIPGSAGIGYGLLNAFKGGNGDQNANP